jgi:hypothetical protein
MRFGFASKIFKADLSTRLDVDGNDGGISDG